MVHYFHHFMMIVVANNMSPSATDSLKIGDRVLVGEVKPGIIVFIGEVHFSPGEWAGVVLDTPTGKNDGTVGGHRYFMCEPKRGVFSRLVKLKRLPGVGGTVMESAVARSSPQLQKADSQNTTSGAGAVKSSSSNVADQKPGAVSLVEKPPSPCQSVGSHHSDQQIPPHQGPSTIHSNGVDHMISRFHFLFLLWRISMLSMILLWHFHQSV